MGSGGSTVPSSSATNYGFPMANLNNWSATEATQRMPVSIAGTISTLYVHLATAPGAGTSWAFTLVKNGVDTALTCTVADAAVTCNDTSNSFSVAAGDDLSVKSVPTNTPASTVGIRWSYKLAGSTTGESTIPGSTRTSTIAANSTVYMGIQGCAAPNSTLNNRDQVMPTGGVIDDFYVKLNAAPGAGQSVTFTLMKNGADTSVTCTVSDSATSCTDLTNTASFVATDTVALKAVTSATATARMASWSFRWLPTIDGEALYLHSSGSAMNTAGSVRYNTTSGTTTSWASGESATITLPGAFTMRKLYIVLNTAPGGAASYTFKNRLNAADGSFSVAISGAATTGNDTSTTQVISNGDRLAFSSLSASTPASSIPKYSFVAFTGSSSTPTPTPTPTNTSAGPTATPTNTPTVTSTPTATATGTPVLYTCEAWTNNNNSGAGSARACLEGTGNKVCVAGISGRVALTTPISITSANMWVSGAPARSMMTNSGIKVKSSNVIVENMELRPGDANPGETPDQRDGILIERGSSDITNVTIRKNSISWAIDENASTYEDPGNVDDVIFEKNIISEGLYFSQQSDVRHSSGCIIWTDRTSFRWNMFANNQNRNCLMKYTSNEWEFINNVVFNAGGTTPGANWLNQEYNALGTSVFGDIISNLFVPGSGTALGSYGFYANPAPATGSKFYLSDNLGPTRPTTGDPEFAITNINPTPYGSGTRVVNITNNAEIVPIATVLPKVAAEAGARAWARNSTDLRIIQAVQTAAAITPTGTPNYSLYGGAYVDCVVGCQTPNPNATATPPHVPTQVPEGGYPVIAEATVAIDCSTGWPKTASEVNTWLAQFETTPTPTPTPTVTPGGPTLTPTPTPAVKPDLLLLGVGR